MPKHIPIVERLNRLSNRVRHDQVTKKRLEREREKKYADAAQDALDVFYDFFEECFYERLKLATQDLNTYVRVYSDGEDNICQEFQLAFSIGSEYGNLNFHCGQQLLSTCLYRREIAALSLESVWSEFAKLMIAKDGFERVELVPGSSSPLDIRFVVAWTVVFD